MFYFELLFIDVGKTLELWVQEVDYLRILEGGNLINFVAMAVDKGDKLSVVKTDTLRLKVSKMLHIETELNFSIFLFLLHTDARHNYHSARGRIEALPTSHDQCVFH